MKETKTGSKISFVWHRALSRVDKCTLTTNIYSSRRGDTRRTPLYSMIDQQFQSSFVPGIRQTRNLTLPKAPSLLRAMIYESSFHHRPKYVKMITITNGWLTPSLTAHFTEGGFQHQRLERNLCFANKTHSNFARSAQKAGNKISLTSCGSFKSPGGYWHSEPRPSPKHRSTYKTCFWAGNRPMVGKGQQLKKINAAESVVKGVGCARIDDVLIRMWEIPYMDYKSWIRAVLSS